MKNKTTTIEYKITYTQMEERNINTKIKEKLINSKKNKLQEIEKQMLKLENMKQMILSDLN